MNVTNLEKKREQKKEKMGCAFKIGPRSTWDHRQPRGEGGSLEVDGFLHKNGISGEAYLARKIGRTLVNGHFDEKKVKKKIHRRKGTRNISTVREEKD